MRLVPFVFWTSNALLVAAGGAFAWTRAHGCAVSPRAPSPAPAVSVVRFRPSALSAVRPPDSGTAEDRRGWIEFRPGPDATLIGIADARVFPVEGDRLPDLQRGQDLTTAQVAGRLDVRQWLQRDGVPTDVFLSYDLILRDAAGREEYRQGWARLDVIALRAAGASIEAPARERIRLDVLTAEGQAIPGALVLVDPEDVSQSGLASQVALTSEDGSVVVSGLPIGAKFRATLANGVGPDARPVSVAIDGGGPGKELRVALPGKWRFVRHDVHFALDGSSTRVTEFKMTDPMSAGAWPVSRWVAPGRGHNVPFWVMFPATETARAEPAHLLFAQRDAVHVPDLATPTNLVFSPWTHDVKVVGAAAKRNEPEANAPDPSHPR